MARAYTKRPGVIAFTGGYHGRTMMTLGLTGKVAPYKVGFGPFPGEVFHALYPNALHGVSVDDALHSVELLFKNDIEPERVAAFILEPVQGEGGFYVAPPEFVAGLRALAKQGAPRGQYVMVDSGGRAIIMLPERDVDLGIVREDERIVTTLWGPNPDAIKVHQSDPRARGFA